MALIVSFWKSGGILARAVPPLFLAAVLALLPAPLDARMRTSQLWLLTAGGERRLDIEVAESLEEKSLGLMFRAALPQGQGMLFPYDAPRPVTMWMKNTFISLDMVFIRADGTVHRVEKRTEPQSEKVISSNGPVLAVLEIGAGEADRLGLAPGDRVRYSLWPDKR